MMSEPDFVTLHGCQHEDVRDQQVIREHHWLGKTTYEIHCAACGGVYDTTSESLAREMRRVRNQIEVKEIHREMIAEHPILGRSHLLWLLFWRIEYRWRQIDGSNQHHDTSEIPF